MLRKLSSCAPRKVCTIIPCSNMLSIGGIVVSVAVLQAGDLGSIPDQYSPLVVVPGFIKAITSITGKIIKHKSPPG